MSPPSTDLIKDSTEKLASFVAWIAELIQKRNWFTLLLLVDVAWFFFGNRAIANSLYQWFTGTSLPAGYAGFYWLVLGVLFIAALIVAVATMPRPITLDVSEGAARKAIKGLRSFGVEDAEIFAKLQRNESLKDGLESISRSDFRFGILIGESGCGKTSFLQAGLLPRLSQPEATLRGVYVKFSDRPPIETVAAALIDHLKLPKSHLEQPHFLTLLTVAVEAAQKPVVLLFDQFEQFFVHQPRPSDRQPFIDALTEWYCSPDPLPVKILVSIRADLMHELHAVQQALGYTLSRYQIFKLEKFDPEEATEILRVFAETEEIGFERRFVEELTQSELTTTEGKVSPVDLQICAELVRKQKAAEQRAFSREAFQKLGGVEGLLNRYLEETLEDLRLQGHLRLYQTALQVMLMLTDRERNVRAGILAIAKLQEMLKGTATAPEVNTAVNWLLSGEVRLITPVERNAIIGYELAHERIIPPLLRLAGKELKEVDRANQLLERRVNEWVGNNRDRRYLLTWQELWLLRRYKTQLTWGEKRRIKEQLIWQSQKRLYQRVWAAVAVIILGAAGWMGWLTPPVQRQYAQWDLVRRSVTVNHTDRSAAATAFAKNQDWEQARTLVNSMQSDPVGVAQALTRIAEVAVALKQLEIPETNLEQALNIARQIQDDRSKSDVLNEIAQVYSKLDDPTTAQDLLEQAQRSAEKIQEDSNKSFALMAIAQTYDKLDNPTTAKEVLEQAQSSAEKIQESFFKSSVLSEIAQVYSQLDDATTTKELLEQARSSAEKIQEDSIKSYALSPIARAYSELDDVTTAKELLEQLRIRAEQFQEDSQSTLLGAIARAYGELDDATIAKEGLEQLRVGAEQFQEDSNKSTLLGAIAQAYGELDDATMAEENLEQLRTSAEDIQEDSNKINALSAIASAYNTLGDPDTARELLDQATTIAHTIQEPFLKSRAFRTIVKAQCELADAHRNREPQETRAILHQARDYVELIQNDYDFYAKSKILQAMVTVWVKLNGWQQVNQTANLCTSEECRVSVLTTALTTQAEQRHPELIEPEEEIW